MISSTNASLPPSIPTVSSPTTTVLGEVEDVEFKTTGKEILSQGWRFVYAQPTDTTAQQQQNVPDDEEKKGDEERTLPSFVER